MQVFLRSYKVAGHFIRPYLAAGRGTSDKKRDCPAISRTGGGYDDVVDVRAFNLTYQSQYLRDVETDGYVY